MALSKKLFENQRSVQLGFEEMLGRLLETALAAKAKYR